MEAIFRCSGIVFDLDGVLADSTHAVNASWEAFEESFADSVAAVSGAPEFVRRVDELRIPWAVATSGTRRIAVPRLERARIPKPPVLITADDVARGKPDPEPYERAAQAMGAAPWQCLVFEDAPAGIRSARRAGAFVVAIACEPLAQADAAALDFLDVDIARNEDGTAQVAIRSSTFRCECCDCHAKARADASCALCRWSSTAGYALEEARENVRCYGVMYRPTDRAFAPSRHPILGPAGEYAIDRVALRERARREFLAFGEGRADRVHLTARLRHLLACLQHADSLYRG